MKYIKLYFYTLHFKEPIYKSNTFCKTYKKLKIGDRSGKHYSQFHKIYASGILIIFNIFVLLICINIKLFITVNFLTKSLNAIKQLISY